MIISQFSLIAFLYIITATIIYIYFYHPKLYSFYYHVSAILYVCTYHCSTVECDTAGLRLDLVFIIDSSASIGSSNFNSLKQAIENIITPLTISRTGTRVAVVQFSTDVSLLFNLNAHNEKNSLLEAIRNIRYTGGFTNTAEALRLLRTSTLDQLLGVRPVEGIPVAILITDGQSNNPAETRQQALALRNETEFEVFAVGVGNDVRRRELINIAGDPEFVIQIENFNASEFNRFENLFAVQACRGEYSQLCVLFCCNGCHKNLCFVQLQILFQPTLMLPVR